MAGERYCPSGAPPLARFGVDRRVPFGLWYCPSGAPILAFDVGARAANVADSPASALRAPSSRHAINAARPKENARKGPACVGRQGFARMRCSRAAARVFGAAGGANGVTRERCCIARTNALAALPAVAALAFAFD